MRRRKIFLGLVFALLGMCFSQKSMAADTLEVVYNYSSGIKGANYTATLQDGTVLGFQINGDYFNFTGAVSEQTELSIPNVVKYRWTEDSLTYNDSTEMYDTIYVTDYNYYDVRYLGAYVYNFDTLLDFSQATNVSVLYLPATIDGFYYSKKLPSNITELHLKGYFTSNVSSSTLNKVKRVYVQPEDFPSFENSNTWSQNVIILEEGKEMFDDVTINVTTPGTFGQTLLDSIEFNSWKYISSLTVTGALNSEDLDIFKRIRRLSKLDLSGASFSSIPSNFARMDDKSLYFLEEVSLPQIDSIYDYAFYNCSRLKTINFPEGLTYIGTRAFYDCDSLTTAEFPSTLKTISSYAFAYCYSLETVDFPLSLTEIGQEAFYKCQSLTEITIPDSITYISYYTFQGCYALTKVTLPKGLKNIMSYAFAYCSNLKEINFPEGLQSIYYNAFYGCNLEEVDLPSTMLSIGSAAFYGNDYLKKVISRSVVPPTASSSIIDGNGVDLYVPNVSIVNYMLGKDVGWQTFANIYPLDDKISSLYIYKDLLLKDISQIDSVCSVTITNYNNNIGTLKYLAPDTLHADVYQQDHSIKTSYNNNSSIYTSLINDGAIKSDSSVTKLNVESSYYWYFISFPYDVKVSDIGYTKGCQFVIRRYSGLDRAQQTGNTWQGLTIDSTMHAYEGYILKCSMDNASFTFPAANNSNNHLFANDDVIMPISEYVSEFAHNASWNFIGNPYPCYYDTRRMEFTAPITVWNRYYNRYDAYSPVDDEYILTPLEAFFIQRPDDQDAITFTKEGRQTTSDVQPLQDDAKKSDKAKSQDRHLFNILLTDGTTTDRTRIVLNEKASLGYELDKDAEKIIDQDNSSMLVYTLTNNNQFAINERPLDNAKVDLGLYANESGSYTISLQTKENRQVILVDTKENTQTVLSDGQDYTFLADKGYTNDRFYVLFVTSAGIEEVAAVNDVEISLVKNTLTVNEDYTVYSIDGKKITDSKANGSVILNTGAYVVVTKNVNRKIVVK